MPESKRRIHNKSVTDTTQSAVRYVSHGRSRIVRYDVSGAFKTIATRRTHPLKRRVSFKVSAQEIASSAEILARIKGWAGDEAEALAWYRSFPIPAFGDRTAESLVKSGRAEDVRDYLDAVAVGSYQ